MPRALATATASATRSAMMRAGLLGLQEPAVGLAGDRRQRVDADVDHELAPHEARHVRAHVRLETGRRRAPRQSGASFSLRPSDMQMCVGPFPAWRMRPGPRNVAPCEVTPAAVRSDAEVPAEDGLVAQPVLEGEHDRVLPRAGSELGRRLLRGRGLHEDDQHVGAVSGLGVGARPRAGNGDRARCRVLDCQPVGRDLLHVLPEDVVQHDVVAGEGEPPAEE